MEVAATWPQSQVVKITTLCLFATGCLFFVVAIDANAEENRPTLTVQVLNLAGVDAAQLGKAEAEASWIFGKAGMKVDWDHCRPNMGDPTEPGLCRDNEDGLTFSLGLVEEAPDFLRDTGMGFALVHSGGRNHAGVVHPRVVEVARAYPLIVKPYLVLAYAMVHELAHLILGSTGHSPTGIMRAGCRPEELAALSQRRLLFGANDIKELKKKVVERNGREKKGITN